MKAYTDYPMSLANGHVINSEVVQVEVLSYDRNKYCWVKWKGDFHHIKSGYLFLDPELKGKSWKWLYDLPCEIDGKKPTRHRVMAELKRLRKHRTIYTVYDYEKERSFYGDFSSLKSALLAVGNRTRYGVVKMRRYHVEYILKRSESTPVVFVNRKNKSVVKRRHLKKFKLI